MSRVRLQTIEEDLRESGTAGPAARLLCRAEVLGLLPGTGPVEVLDRELLRSTLKNLATLGVGRTEIVSIPDGRRDSGGAWREALHRVEQAVEACPMPERSWAGVIDILGSELLARLLGISESSVRRYDRGDRHTPDDVATRLHHLVLIVADLAGAYNEYGIRRWFDRPREALDGASPGEVLQGDWDPDDDGPRLVRALAWRLTGSPAT